MCWGFPIPILKNTFQEVSFFGIYSCLLKHRLWRHWSAQLLSYSNIIIKPYAINDVYKLRHGRK